MNAPHRNIGQDLPKIRQLDEIAVNQIAAGEVVERPASAVKELVENALDAGATRIEVALKDGGKTLIRVTDDGHGMSADNLPLALSRHATSKIDGSDLLNIHTFGFRGEALASLGAVGRLTLTSRARSSDTAHTLSVSGGQAAPLRPAALSVGTIVELRDLFYATPARLKFLRTDRAEMQAISDVIKRLAMAEPYVGFTIRDLSGGDQGRVTFRADPETGDMFTAMNGRLRQILGAEFAQNALQIDAEREGITLTGFAALPTYSRGAATAQVRFRDPGLARGLIVSALKHALAEAGHRASTTVADATLGAFRPEPTGRVYQMDMPSQQALRGSYAAQAPGSYAAQAPGFSEAPAPFAPTSARVEEVIEDTPQDTPLGAARAQVHENYIIAQTSDGMVIVDQHAAHERLVYEKLKRQMAENGVATQALLIPEIVELSEGDAALLLEHLPALASFGLVIEPFGQGAVAVRETPAILGVINAEKMLRDILDEISDLGDSQTLAAPHLCGAETGRYRTVVWPHMIQIGTYSFDLSDPLVIAALIGAGIVLLFLLLLILSLRASARSARAAEPLIGHVSQLAQTVQSLSQGQAQLTGGLEGVSKSQAMTLQTMEVRMAEVQQKMSERLHENAMKSARSLSDLQERMNDTLHGSSEKTTKSLTQLQERLATIDRAQTNIEKLSGDVLSLQDILSNKQTRGAFGEIQLNDIVTKAMPADSYSFQTTLSNGKRADCLINLPNPPGPIVIDAKFPLEAYEALVLRGRLCRAARQAAQHHSRRL